MPEQPATAAPATQPPGGGAPIPVTVIGGYLGAGKTTLVNALLRQAGGARIAVLVNDFGDIAIDADLIEAREGDLLQLAGGCVCCSVGSDLVSTLMSLPARMQARPDHVLLETSGVAMPGMVAATLSLVGGIRRDGVIVLADALHLDAQWRDRYLADTIERQLASADLIVLGKCDLVDAPSIDALERALRERHPDARLVRASHGELPIGLVLGLAQADDAEGATDATGAEPTKGAQATKGLEAAKRAVRRRRRSAGSIGGAAGAGATRAPGRLRRVAAADERYASLALRAPDPVDVERLVALLAAADSPVLRSKGFARDLRSHAWMSFHTVARQVDVRALEGRPPSARAHFVVIGERRRLTGIDAIAGLAELGVVEAANTGQNPSQ